MLATIQELCPNVIQHNSKSLQDLQVLSETKSRIPKDFVKNLVNDTIGVEVYNKVNEMNLILANHISDKVIDDVIDNLARTYKGLVGDLGSMKKKRSLTPDVLKVNIVKQIHEICQNQTYSENTKWNFRDLVNDLIAKVKAMLFPKLVITIVKNPLLAQSPPRTSQNENLFMTENWGLSQLWMVQKIMRQVSGLKVPQNLAHIRDYFPCVCKKKLAENYGWGND